MEVNEFDIEAVKERTSEQGSVEMVADASNTTLGSKRCPESTTGLAGMSQKPQVYIAIFIEI
jgi:hypothetical protein